MMQREIRFAAAIAKLEAIAKGAASSVAAGDAGGVVLPQLAPGVGHAVTGRPFAGQPNAALRYAGGTSTNPTGGF